MIFNKDTKQPLGKDDLKEGTEVLVKPPHGDGFIFATVTGPNTLESHAWLMNAHWDWPGEWRILGYGNKQAVRVIELYGEH
jgi:hypothetical protein